MKPYLTRSELWRVGQALPGGEDDDVVSAYQFAGPVPPWLRQQAGVSPALALLALMRAIAAYHDPEVYYEHPCQDGFRSMMADAADRFWTPLTHWQRRIPRGIKLPNVEDWQLGGYQMRTVDLVRRYPHLTAYGGYVLFPQDGETWAREHCWAVTPRGWIVDPSTGTCGVPYGWSYAGAVEGSWMVPLDEE